MFMDVLMPIKGTLNGAALRSQIEIGSESP